MILSNRAAARGRRYISPFTIGDRKNNSVVSSADSRQGPGLGRQRQILRTAGPFKKMKSFNAIPLLALASVFLLVSCDSGSSPSPTPGSGPQPGFSQPMAPSQPTLPPEARAILEQGQALQMQLDQITETLATVQEQAMDVERVIEMRESLEAAAEEEMLKLKPDVKPALERLPELVKILEANEEINSQDPATFSEEAKKLIAEYETLSGEIQPLQAQVAVIPEIETARKALFEAIQEECLKIDPEFERLEKDYARLGSQLEGLRQEYIAAQQQAQGFSIPNPDAPGPSPQANPATEEITPNGLGSAPDLPGSVAGPSEE